jgi:hypothetical protein
LLTTVASALLDDSDVTDPCSTPTCDATAADCDTCSVLTVPSSALVAAIPDERMASTDLTLLDSVAICPVVEVDSVPKLVSV